MTFSGKLGQLSVYLVWNGKCAINGVDNVGTVPASLSTYLAIQAINPDLVISAGTAGGFKAQVIGFEAISITFVSLSFLFKGSSARNRFSPSTKHCHKCDYSQGAAIGDIFLSSSTINHDRRIPIPGFDKYGIGQHHSNPSPLMQSELGFKLGVVSSGNSLDYTDKCLEIMGSHNVSGGSVKDTQLWSHFSRPTY